MDGSYRAAASTRCDHVAAPPAHPRVDAPETSAATSTAAWRFSAGAIRLAKVKLDPSRLEFTDVFLREASPRGRYVTGDAFASDPRAPADGRPPGCLRVRLPLRDRKPAAPADDLGALRHRTPRSHLAGNRHQAARTPRAAARGSPAGDHPVPYKSAPAALPLRLPWAAVCARASRLAGVRLLGDFKRAWETACTKGRLPGRAEAGGFIFHNTRHTASPTW